MRLVIQRVRRSAVSVSRTPVSQAGRGVMVLVGITRDDNDQDIQTLAKKLVNLRVYAGPPAGTENNTTAPTAINDDDTDSKSISDDAPFYVNEATTPGAKTWSKSVMDIGGDFMIVSQFTLAHVMKGNKPDFHLARGTEEARVMFDQFVKQVNTLYDAFIKEKSPKPQQQQQKGGKTKKQLEREATKANDAEGVGNNKPSVEQKEKAEEKKEEQQTQQAAASQVYRGKVAVGAFGEHMDIDVDLDGPVTIVLDSNIGEKEKEKMEQEKEEAFSATQETK